MSILDFFNPLKHCDWEANGGRISGEDNGDVLDLRTEKNILCTCFVLLTAGFSVLPIFSLGLKDVHSLQQSLAS